MSLAAKSAIRQRGRYSKKGCRQCKTRRIKCDEGKPTCWQCSRLKKVCNYGAGGGDKSGSSGAQNLRFIRYGNSRTNDHRDSNTQNVWQGKQRWEQNDEESCLEEIKSLAAPDVGGITGEPYSKLPAPTDEENERRSSASLTSPDSNSGSFENHGSWPSQTRQRPGSISHHDLNLLALDLDGIINGMMSVAQTGMSNESLRIENKTLVEEETANDENPHKLPSHKEFPRALPFDYIPMATSHDRLYFEEFYTSFTTIIQPFLSYDDTHGYYCTARDIFLDVASREPFLLSAILSQGARMSFEKHALKEDQDASYRYLIKCLRLFEPALLRSRDDSNIVSNKIEGVLLTILLLVSANASILDLGWRSHLRGAKELLLKFSSGERKRLRLFKSKIIVFCKHWFISFEILAALSSRRGGTLQKDQEMDLILTTTPADLEILQEIGIVRPDGFNLLTGIHYSCLIPISRLIKLLNRVRGDGTTNSTLDVIGLLGQFHEQLQIEFVKRDGTIREFRSTSISEGLLLDSVSRPEGTVTISWMDISHQSNVLALMVLLLRKGLQLPISNQHVQSVNRTLLGLMAFLTECRELSVSSKCSMLLLQWPMLIGGLNCVTDDERLVAMRFFRNLANIGTTSSTYALRKFNKVWKRPDRDAERDYLDSSSDVDVFTY